MNYTLDEVTINYEEDGVLLVKELDKEILSKGLWSTIMFKYAEWNVETQDYGPCKYSIRRYKKTAGEYRMQSKFTLSSNEQAIKIRDVLSKWIENVKEE